MMNGKLRDVLIEDIYYPDETGLKQRSDSIRVWADPHNKNVIKSVEGVTNVYTNLSEFEYSVYLDPRYDHEFVKAEIEAAILCKEEK